MWDSVFHPWGPLLCSAVPMDVQHPPVHPQGSHVHLQVAVSHDGAHVTAAGLRLTEGTSNYARIVKEPHVFNQARGSCVGVLGAPPVLPQPQRQLLHVSAAATARPAALVHAHAEATTCCLQVCYHPGTLPL